MVFKILQGENKEQIALVNTNMPNLQLEVFEIPLSSFQNTNFEFMNKKEFAYNGKLYDIVKQKIVKDKVYFYCINDKKETHFFANLLEHLKNTIDINSSLPIKNKGDKETTKNIVKDFYPLNNTNAFKPEFSMHQLIYTYNLYYVSPSRDIFSPPPQV